MTRIPLTPNKFPSPAAAGRCIRRFAVMVFLPLLAACGNGPKAPGPQAEHAADEDCVFDESYIYANPVFSGGPAACSTWDSVQRRYTALTERQEMLSVAFWACRELAMDAALYLPYGAPEADRLQAGIEALAARVLQAEDQQSLVQAARRSLQSRETGTQQQTVYRIEVPSSFYDDFFVEYLIWSDQALIRIYYIKT
ncbi:MAG: hypothetical protein NW241_14515 [Bacteroidia bacterium]|nr:hypothetical protein [Bacteroidia bacterium]